MQERKTSHIWLYLACDQMVFGVRQLQRNNWVKQHKRECFTRAIQPMMELCMGVRQLLGDLCVGVRHLPLKDFCVGVKQLLADGSYSLELDNSMNKSSWN